MESNTGNGKVVCVTGASGFIASWLVKLLLLRGYTVKGTVRDPNDSVKVDHLLKLDGAKERLQLIKANLMDEGSFDEAVAGCEGVFHTASPVFHNVKDPQTELIDPAVKGTLNVLKSCAKSPSVKRVIFTSSTAAVLFNGKPTTLEVVVDETWFSNPDICRENKLWYALSKTLAEDAAWKFAKENNIDMVALNPAMVIGPVLQPSLNRSNLSIAQEHMKKQANSHRRQVEFQVGDFVFLKVQPYRQTSLSAQRFTKLSARYFGPYSIIRRIGKVAYELQLPPGSKVHPIFHVSLLKQAHGCDTVSDSPLPVNDHWELTLQPDKVLSSRLTTTEGETDTELLIQWKDRPHEESSWESYDDIAHQFPSFSLEDKAYFLGEGIDRDPTRGPLLVYSRRKRPHV